jgi:hypothetical protein
MSKFKENTREGKIQQKIDVSPFYTKKEVAQNCCKKGFIITLVI